MPASLLALANELLLSIADSLQSERSINAFARTNRRPYLVINDYLYRHNAIEGESSALWWAAITGLSCSAAKSVAQVDNVNICWWDIPEDSWKPGFTCLRRFGGVDGEWRLLHLLDLNCCVYYTPIYAAVLSGHVKVVDLLVLNGVDMELSLGKWANPLQAAAQTGQLQVVQQLVKQESAIDKPGYKNITALHLACLEGHDMVVQYLIEVGANVMARDDELNTPLHLALKELRGRSRVGSLLNGFLRTVQWLLISGADMHAVNRKQHTPLIIAKNMKGTDVGCLFKEGSAVAIYESRVLWRQPGCKSISLQRLWDAYLDKQTEAAIEALRTNKHQVEAAAREKSSKQNLKMQQEQEAKRRQAAKQKQVEEKTRIERDDAEQKA